MPKTIIYPWEDVRKQIGDVSGGGKCKEPDLCRGCVYDLLSDADALLAVRRALHTGNYSQDDPVLRKAIAALPEYLR